MKSALHPEEDIVNPRSLERPQRESATEVELFWPLIPHTRGTNSLNLVLCYTPFVLHSNKPCNNLSAFGLRGIKLMKSGFKVRPHEQ